MNRPISSPSSPWAVRESGYTLIEMMVVTMIIALMAALIMPNVVAMKRSRDLKDTQAKILRLPIEARNEAIRSGRPVQLRFDGEDLVMYREPAPGMSNAINSSQPASLTVGETTQTGAAGTQGGTAGTTDEESNTEQEVKRVPLGSSISTAGNIDVTAESATAITVLNPAAMISTSGSTGTAGGGGSGTTDVASWKWTAYPDGTQDGGGITFRIGEGQVSLLIPFDGTTPKWAQGSLPPSEDEKWPAGDLLRRS